MEADSTDWRLQGQEKYLKNEILHFKRYSERITKTEHDHCEFCSSKFSENDKESLMQGYCTKDEYRWICEDCFKDFKVTFNLKLIDD